MNESDNLFFSKAACIDLSMITENFPKVRELRDNSIPYNHPEFVRPQFTTNAVIGDNSNNPVPKCVCPRRALSPPLPTVLPFSAIEKNQQKLQDYLLDYYCSSTLKTCEHKPLPLIAGQPLPLQVDLQGTTVAHHSIIPVPAH